MSLASTIAHLSVRLRSMADSARSRTVQLLEEAPQGIEGLLPRQIGTAKYRVTRPSGGAVDAPPLAVPNPTVPDLPDPPALQPVDVVSSRFTVEPPDLTPLPERALPQITWRELPSNTPVLTPPTLTPTVPTLTEAQPPTLRQPVPVVAVDPATPSPPGLGLPPNPPDFDTQPLDLYREGLGLAQGSTGGMSAWLAQLREQSKAAEAALLAQLQAILSGAPVLPESWEQQNSGLDRAAIEAERRTGLEALDVSPGTQTGMPTGTRIAQKLDVEFNALRALIAAAAQSAQERQGYQIKTLIQAVQTAGQMADQGLDLRAKEIDWISAAWDAILDGAEAAGAVIRQKAAWEKKRQAWTADYNQFQAKRLRGFLRIEQAKLQRLQINQNNDALIVGYNRHVGDLRQIASQVIEHRIALFSEQIDWLGEDEKYRMQAWRGYELAIERYAILVKRGTAERRLLHAQLDQDQTRIAHEQQKVQHYAAQLQALSAESSQAVAHAQAVATQNQTTLEGFTAHQDAQAALVRSLSQEMKQALSVILKNISAEGREQELALRQQELADRRALHKAAIALSEEHTALMATLKQHERLIRQRLARGKTQAQGASVLGGIAMEAASGFNALGIESAEESA